MNRVDIESCLSPREMKVAITKSQSWTLGKGLKILSHAATSNGADVQKVRGSST